MVEGQDVETEVGHFYGFYYGFILWVLGRLFIFSYYCQNGSCFQFSGNPISFSCPFGQVFNKSIKFFLNSLSGAIIPLTYTIADKLAYSLYGYTRLFKIKSDFVLLGIVIGIAILRFQSLPWCAQMFLMLQKLCIQFSKTLLPKSPK